MEVRRDDTVNAVHKDHPITDGAICKEPQRIGAIGNYTDLLDHVAILGVDHRVDADLFLSRTDDF